MKEVCKPLACLEWVRDKCGVRHLEPVVLWHAPKECRNRLRADPPFEQPLFVIGLAKRRDRCRFRHRLRVLREHIPSILIWSEPSTLKAHCLDGSRYFKAVAPDMDETTVRKHPSKKWEPKVVDRKH